MKILKATYKREFSRYEKVYFVGGGSYFIDNSVSNFIQKVDLPEYYNAMGYLFFKNSKVNQ